MSGQRWARWGFGAIFLLSLLVFLFNSFVYDVCLTPDIRWRLLHGNESVLLDDKTGQIIAGPGLIELWGEYPYIGGSVCQEHTGQNFVYDITARKLLINEDAITAICCRLDIVPGNPMSRYVTVHDILRSCQWYREDKKDALRLGLSSPKFAWKEYFLAVHGRRFAIY
jgi:hypothetical protein